MQFEGIELRSVLKSVVQMRELAFVFTCRYAHHAQQAPAQHELYVFRDALVPKTYSPAAFRRPVA